MSAGDSPTDHLSDPGADSPKLRVAAMGSGGVGGYFGALLARHGHQVTFIARGAHLAAIQRDGLTVHSAQRGDFQVAARATDDPASVGAVDLVLFCVKSYDTESAGRAILPMLGPDTIVLTLQNGLDNEDLLEAIVPRGQLMGGAARVESTIAAPGVIHQLSPMARIDFGELMGPPTPRAERLLEAFKQSTWDVHLMRDLRLGLWQKFVGLSAMAGVTTLADVTWGELKASPDLCEMLMETVRESVRVARADGYELGDDQAEKMMTMPVATPGMKTSMQRDRERGKRLEVEALNGTTVRLGRKYGVPTPVNLAIYASLKVFDDRAAAAR